MVLYIYILCEIYDNYPKIENLKKSRNNTKRLLYQEQDVTRVLLGRPPGSLRGPRRKAHARPVSVSGPVSGPGKGQPSPPVRRTTTGSLSGEVLAGAVGGPPGHLLCRPAARYSTCEGAVPLVGRRRDLLRHLCCVVQHGKDAGVGPEVLPPSTPQGSGTAQGEVLGRHQQQPR